MKGYEALVRQMLEPHTHTILRVDGRAFHSYLRGAEKPYDFGFIAQMQGVAAHLCKEVSGTVMAYGQSDEISLLLSDIESQSQPWFGGVVQKMASVAAGIATASLIAKRGPKGLPHFDARVFTIPSEEVGNYFVWRQRDAIRNSVSMLAQYKFSHKQLHGVNSEQMKQKLLEEYGISWEGVPPAAKYGWVVKKHLRESPVTYTDKRTQEVVSGTAVRTFWEPEFAPKFSAEDIFAGASTEAVL
jgi:tRNA(His) 5'-end guanylyltransferase